MQILNNLLLGNEALNSSELSNELPYTVEISAETGTDTDFSKYLDTELSSLAPLTMPVVDAQTEMPFLAEASIGHILPQSEEMLTTTSGVSTLNSQDAPRLLALSDTHHHSISGLHNRLTESNINVPDEASLAKLTSTVNNETVMRSDEGKNHELLKVANNENNMAKGNELFDLNDVGITDLDDSVESNLLAEKKQVLGVTEDNLDVGVTERSITALHKPGTLETGARDNILSSQIKENFTLKADDNFSERLGEKIDLLIKNNQREAKISLDPAGLGKVDVQIKMINNEYVVNIVTQSDSAQQVLDQHSSKLKQLFENESLTFNLSQQQNSGHSERNQNDFSSEEQRSINVATDPSHNNMMNNQVQYLSRQSVFTQDSVNLYI